MKDFFAQISAQIARLNKQQKNVLAGAVGLIVIILFVSLAWAGKTEWGNLFTGELPPKENGRIAKMLDELKVNYRLGEDDSTIMVPKRDKARITMLLAQNDSLPGATTGWTEIFKESSIMGRTREREKLDFVRGLQGELEHTIKSQLEPVADARVHITLPEVRLFVEDRVLPTAAVVLRLKPYEDLKDNQIRGIMNLVASAVEGLEPKNVKILDTLGTTLSERIEFEHTDQKKVQTVLEIQQEYEQEISRKVQGMLARVLGQGKVIAKAAVEFDFDKIESKIREFAPPIPGEDVGIMRSQETEVEAYEGTGVFPGGVPGVDTNIPGYKGVDQEKSKYDRKRAINNFEINTTEKHLIKSPGTIRRMTISVLVDDQYKLRDDQQEALQANVEAAIGFVRGRDEIKFTQIRFSTDDIDRLREAMEEERQRRLIVTVALIASAIFFLIGWLFLRWLKLRREARLRAIADQLDEDTVIDLEETFDTVLSVEEQERRDLQERLKRHAQEYPDQVAQLLRAWIIEEA